MAAGLKARPQGSAPSHNNHSQFRKFVYDLILWAFVIVFDCFFKEIRSRGGYKVPKNEPIIFVAAPHANQFVDPIVLMSQVKEVCGRRVSCLIAEKSHRKKFIGLVSRSQLAIPVKRAQDNLESKNGTIKLDVENELRILGKGTKFLSQCEVKGLLSLPKSIGTSEISEIVSDTEMFIKKPFRFTSEEKAKTGLQLLKNGTSFKSAPKIDQSEVYAQVFEHLASGHCLGVFSEGGSHDRPDLLPLKAGVAIMALGAMDSNPGLKVKIVPVGMNYFHAHKFRSRAVVEFGNPIEISQELVDKYSKDETSKDAVKELLEQITRGVKACTVNCPDFEILSVVQAARRLYSDNISSKLSAPSIVEMNRRLIKGYLHFKDDPKMQYIKNKVLEYNENLKSFNIPDHLVGQAQEMDISIVFRNFLSHLAQVIVLSLLALPGVILFAPVFIATKRISEQKRKEALAGSTVKIRGNDVIATWKILVSMGLTPILYTFYSAVGTYLVKGYYPNLSKVFVFILFYAFSASITYSALIFGDKGVELGRSVRADWAMLIHKQGFNQLKDERDELSKNINQFINEFGPQIYPDFDLFEYEKKLEQKRLRKIERRKLMDLKLDSNLDDEDQIEELKTQSLRKRRSIKKNIKMNMIKNTPIMEDMLISASTSEIDTESECESSTDGTTLNESQEAIVNLVRDKVMKAREEETTEDGNKNL